MKSLYEQFYAARAVSTPLVAVSTPDYRATMDALGQPSKREQETGEHYPRFMWDVIGGLTPLNKSGEAVLPAVLQQAGLQPKHTVSPVETLILAASLPPYSMLFFLNAHRELDKQNAKSKDIAAAIWKLRDPFKGSSRTLILLSPGLSLPEELANDVLMLDEELPGDEALGAIITRIAEAAKMEPPEGKEMHHTVEAMRGLAAFPAEQALAMSVKQDRAEGDDGTVIVTRSIDRDTLWLRKKSMIDQTPGLSISKGGAKFSDIGGLGQIKKLTTRLFEGNEPPTAIIFIDEIEKALAGAGGDMSGTSQDALGVLLSAMQDNNWKGYLAVGFPGTGKSYIAQATGNEGGVPTISLDMGAAKGSLVGDSEAKIRQAVKVIKGVAGEGAFFIGTANRLTDDAGRSMLPPELLRRFPYGRIFFDLPDAMEREIIWNLYRKKYGLEGDNSHLEIGDEGWTPAEIKTCTELAYRLKIPMREASEFIVPFAQSEADWVTRLRNMAHGKFLSAKLPGAYRAPGLEGFGDTKQAPNPSTPGGRMFLDN